MRGVGDAALQAKWRFYDDGAGWTLGIKPMLTLPTGDSARGLGHGRATAGTVLLAQRETERWSWLLNAGATWNDNRVGERRWLWSASSALLYKLGERWALAADGAVGRAADPAAGGVARAVTLGLIWHPDARTDLDIGWRRSLGGAALTRSLGIGFTRRW